MQLDPLNSKAFRTMAWVLIDGEQYQQAIEILTQALESWPRDLRLMSTLNSAHFSAGDYGEALEVSNAIAAIDPDNFSNWQSQFEAYMDLDAIPEAGEALARMQQLAPERAHDEAAKYELHKGNVDGYRAYLRKYNETRTWSRAYRAVQLAVSEGHYDDALAIMTGDHGDDGWTISAFFKHTLIAVIAGETGKTTVRDQALAVADEALKPILLKMGDSSIAALLRARLASASGDSARASEYIRRAMSNGYRDFDEMISGADFTWLPIRQTPEFLAVIEEIQQRNEATLTEIRTR
jgi:hypothetical protein